MPSRTQSTITSSSSLQDSAYGSSTVYSSSTVLSGLSSRVISKLSRSNSVDSNAPIGKKPHHQRRSSRSSAPPVPSRQLGTYNSFPAHFQRATTPPCLHCSVPSSISPPTARLKAIFKRLLPGRKDHHRRHHAYRSPALVTSQDTGRHYGFALRGQQPHHVPAASETLPTFAPISVHPHSSTPVPPSSKPDVSAPACFPGTGPIDLAVKQQQLAQLQQHCARRPASKSAPASITSLAKQPASSTMLTRGYGRHLIPHHHRDFNLAAAAAAGGVPSGTQEEPLSPVLQPSPPPSESHSRRSSATSALSACSSWTEAIAMFSHDPHVSSSLSGRSIEELEILAALSSMHCDTREGGSTDEQQQQDNSMFSVVSAYHYLSERKGTEPPMRSTFGEGYDISTMFQMGPLPATTVVSQIAAS
ncbi:hypothetical protein BGZ75_003407 [Mortierella antarctica]|nr:hypothetical protein BGZ75_003407 [Mortierella antarctica]